MTEETAAPRKPRTKPQGARNYVVTADGLETLVKLDAMRVANDEDLNRALDGNLPRGKIVDVKAAQS